MPYSYEGVDLREHPEAYEIGRGEQGVFHAQPYKGELLPLWKFKDVRAAEQSSQDIWDKFLEYKAQDDFVGMDVARKYLQMGYTRSRRCAAAHLASHYQCAPACTYGLVQLAWHGTLPEVVVLSTCRKWLAPWICRYAKHKGGTKANRLETEDAEKARCAEIFKAKWRAAAEDATYQELKTAHQRRKR